MNLARETMNEPDADVNEPVVFDAELREQIDRLSMRAKMAEFAADLNRYTVRDQAHALQKMRFKLYEAETAVAKAQAVAEHERRLTRQMRAAFEHERAEGFVSGAMTVCELLEQVARNRDRFGHFYVRTGQQQFGRPQIIDLALLWPSDDEDTTALIGLLMSQAAEGKPLVRICSFCEEPSTDCGGPCGACGDCLPAKGDCVNSGDVYHRQAVQL